MDKSAIKNFSIEARKILMKSAETEAGFYGVTRKGCKNPIQKGNDFEVYETLAGTENRIYGADIKKRANLVEAVETLGFEQVIEETAYTWFNRIIAIRFMEVNGYLPTRVRVLSSETGSNTPDIVTQFLDVDLNMTPEELEKVQKAKDENRYDDAFRMLFVKQCNELNAILPGLFEKTDDYMEPLLKLSYTSDGVARMLVDTVAEDNFNVETEGQIEIIGWMYQYYNTELKDDTFAKLKKNVKITKERIPAATQLFTPDWIVRYMVENSVGRVWIEHLRAMDSSIDEKAKAEEFGWKYYLPEAEQETEVQEKLVEIRKSYLSLEPKDITCIDPCMGSGHILVYMFDVLMDIYQSEGFSERDAVFSILENNIRGLDIDRRAYQLSYFALMMKARGYNRLFLRGLQTEDGGRRFVEPVVFAIEESNDVNREQLKYFGADLNEIEKNNAVDQMNGLLDSFMYAKEYGSILGIKDYDWNLLRKFIDKESTNGQISFDTLGIEVTKKKLNQLMKQGCIMAKKYRVVSTNPPYMGGPGMPTQLSEYVKKNYPDSKSDLFAVFIERCREMVCEHGYQAMITQHAWMFLTSFEMLRKVLLRDNIINMAHLGARAFEEIGGEIVQTTSFILGKVWIDSYKGTYCRLIEPGTQQGKEKMFLEGLNQYNAIQSSFNLIPGSPIAYWATNNAVDLFTEKREEEFARPIAGICTGANDKYFRLWFEVDKNLIGQEFNSRDDVLNQKDKKWFFHYKGGEFRRWYGNVDYVINYTNESIKNMEKNKGFRHDNRDFYFKQGITWSKICSGKFSARYMDPCSMFDSAGTSAFPSDECYYGILGLLNSNIMDYLVQILNPTFAIYPNNIGNIPIKVEIFENKKIEELAKQCVTIAKEDWDSFEFSWNFLKHPMIVQLNKVSDAYERWSEQCNKRFLELMRLEENLNSLLVDIYGLKKEIDIRINELNIAVRKPNRGREIKSFISYAVGCMFGRYSIDEDGLIFAGDNWDSSKFMTFYPNDDGIIPINDSEYFKDDIVCRLEEFLKVVYGQDTLEENLDFIAKVLGNKGNTSRERIRNYFLTDFYKDHCNTYSVTGSGKRPIYWLFDSGKENGFKCLIYMHRYTKDTLNLIRSEYLHKTEDAVENALKNVEYIIQTSTSAVEKAKATKDRDKYVKQINEMRIYYQALSHLAIQKIEIDLDNGVKNNYQLFQGIEVIVDGGKKQKVDLLAKI